MKQSKARKDFTYRAYKRNLARQIRKNSRKMSEPTRQDGKAVGPQVIRRLSWLEARYLAEREVRGDLR